MAKKQDNEQVKEVVSIPKDQWLEMQKRLERLEDSASKARLSRYDDSHRKPIGKTVKLRTYEGKYVIAWADMIKNIVEKDTRNGVWHEEQEVEVYFSDNTKARFPYLTWERLYSKVQCDVKKESIDDKGRKNVTVELPDGEELTVGIEFLN